MTIPYIICGYAFKYMERESKIFAKETLSIYILSIYKSRLLSEVRQTNII